MPYSSVSRGANLFCKIWGPSSILFVCLVISTLSSVPALAKGKWLQNRTSTNPCQVWAHWDKPTYVRWNGKCVDGKGEGEGYLEFYKGDLKIWDAKLSQSSGLTLKKGRMRPSIDMSTVIFRHIWCDRRPRVNVVNVFVDNDIDITQSPVAWFLLKKGAQFGKKKCRYSHSDIAVALNYKDRINAKIYLATTSVGGTFNMAGKIKWKSYKNDLARLRYQSIQRDLRRAKQAKIRAARMAEKKRREDAKRQRLEQEKKKSKALFLKFREKSGAQTWTNVTELSTNPFIFEGKRIGLRTKFESMIERHKGLFGYGLTSYITVSNLPSRKFTTKSEVLLVGHVKGKEHVKLPLLGDILVTHLSFIDVYFCKKSNCDDIFLWVK